MLIVANWKANKTLPEAEKWLTDYQTLAATITGRVEVAIAAPYLLLDFLRKKGMEIASQDISGYPVGPYTGEIPAPLLLDLGVRYCLIGHSERRKYFKEDNSSVAAKFEQAVTAGIIPIICAQTEEEIPENIGNSPAEKYRVMYEPMEAISAEGQYHPEPPEKIKETISSWKAKLPPEVRFLYGGSVNPSDVKQILAVNAELLSGFVVGHASLEAASFGAIIKECL